MGGDQFQGKKKNGYVSLRTYQNINLQNFGGGPVGCPDLQNIQPSKLLYGTVMYGYHMD